jgi:Ca-activated chloride channel homolog
VDFRLAALAPRASSARAAWCSPPVTQPLLDEPALREVARLTGGEYHHAGSAEDLRGVYRTLASRLQIQTRQTELTGRLAMAAAILIVAGSGLSVLWFGRVA